MVNQPSQLPWLFIQPVTDLDPSPRGLTPEAMKHCRWREPFTLALWRCIWPDGSKEIPFVEVLVADGLTSAAGVAWARGLGGW